MEEAVGLSQDKPYNKQTKNLYTSGLSFAAAKAVEMNGKQRRRAQFRIVYIVPELQLTN